MTNMRIVIAGLHNIFASRGTTTSKMEIKKDLETIQTTITKMLKELSETSS